MKKFGQLLFMFTKAARKQIFYGFLLFSKLYFKFSTHIGDKISTLTVRYYLI